MKEANKVVNLLLNDVIEMMDEKEELIENVKEVTLDETCVGAEIKGKTYLNECENCDFVANATKRYIALKQLRKHKHSCCKNMSKQSNCLKASMCNICDFEDKNSMNMRRHMRDEHNIITGSTSPPPKRKRRVLEEDTNSVEEMDTNDNDEGHDISIKLEEMEVDSLDDENKKKLSELKDAKIVENEKRNEENEQLVKDKETEEALKKSKSEEEKMNQSKDINKKRKQMSKTQRKKTNKKIRRNESFKATNDLPKKTPILKNIPENCKHLFQDGDVVYVVPGDGCCGPNSAAAHIFQDEAFGPKLRIKMNKFMGRHWDKRYKMLTQCSEEHPFERKLGNGKISFTDPAKLRKFLRKSKKAAFMWTDSEDLAIIADMYQVRIKVITSFGNVDENPTVNRINPEPSLKQFAEQTNVEVEEMVLLHENECHFNLVVNKDSDLAMKGSLSCRFNIGPLLVDCDEDDDDLKKDTFEKETDELTDADERLQNDELKSELKKCQLEKNKVEKQYLSCELELRVKTEELEKMKIELKDIKEILKLKDELKENGLNESLSKEEETPVKDTPIDGNTWSNVSKRSKIQNKTQIQDKELTCTQCDFKGKSRVEVVKHKNTKHPTQSTEEFNCYDCDFQGTAEAEVRRHRNLKHSLNTEREESTIQCKVCGETFGKKWNFMRHRKDQHIHIVAPCRNEMSRSCSFSAEMCWWNHDRNQNSNNENIKCFICDEMFQSKADMMNHRKRSHASYVRKCLQFEKNNCRYKINSCWYQHDEEMETETVSEDVNINEQKDSEQVFQKVSGNLKPPIQSQKKEKVD